MSLAIGKKGQNVRLAAKLTGWRIDIKSEEEKRKEVEAEFGAIEAAGAEDTPDEGAEPTAAEDAAETAAAERRASPSAETAPATGRSEPEA